MRIGLIKFAAFFCLMALSISAAAQSETQTPAPGSLEAALAVEDPNARILALQKFIRTNSIPEQSQTAREAVVVSWAQLAEKQLGDNNIEKAAANFRKAITALPDNVTDRFFNDTVFRIPVAASLRGYRNEAIALARLVEKRFIKEPVRLAAMGEFYMTVEASADAIRALEAAINLNGEDASLHRSLGAAYRIGLSLDDAVAEYQQAIKLDPADKRAYYELANLYRAHGSYDDAIKLYRKQLEIEPKHSPSYKGLSLAFLAQGNESEATDALNRARDLRGAAEDVNQDIYLQTQMAFYYLSQRKLSQARKAADAALAIEPRYAWARIAAAEVDLAEGKFFDAERNLLAAQRYAVFPTLYFTIGKLYLYVEDFDGALDQFAKAFSYSAQKQFTAKLGGTLDVQSDNLRDLFSREHRAAIFLAEPPTSEEQFRIIGSLVKFNVRLRAIKSAAASRIGGVAVAATRKQLEELDQAATDFIDAENTRRSFRALHIAQTLAQAGIATGTAAELADQALSLADVATEFEGSVRDYPNYDREGRLRVFRGRALDAKGWALYKAGKNEESIKYLSESVQAYGSLPEGKKALWHLATVKETVGDAKDALDLYIAGYEPPAQNAGLDVNRTVIETLYRKINGSLDGFEEKLRQGAAASGSSLVASLTTGAPPPAKPEAPEANESPSKPLTGADSESQNPARVENRNSQFKLSFPTAPVKDQPAPGIRLPQTSSESKDGITLPRTDPMFARPANAQPAEPKSSGSETTTADPAPADAPTPVIALPEIKFDLDPSTPLTPMLNQRELFAQWEGFVIKDELEDPPAPPDLQPAVNTRKRRVTSPLDPSIGKEPPSLRKRRVTAP